MRLAVAGAVAIAVGIAGCGSTAPTPAATGPAIPSAAPAVSGASGPRPVASDPNSPARTPAPSVAAGPGRLVVTLDPRRLSVATTRGVAFAEGSSIVLAGGLTAAGTTGSVIRIPMGTGPITSDGHLAHPVHDAGGATLGSEMLVFGGGASTQDSWVQRVGPLRAGSVVGRLPVARADLAAVVVGREVVVVGGGAAGRADPRVLATSDGVHFRLVARLTIAVRYAAVAAIGNEVFVIGGAATSGDVATIQVVDVAAGTSRVVGTLGATRSHATAFVLGGRILVAGGRHHGVALDSIVAVNPATDHVSRAGTLPAPASDAAGVVVNGVGYLIGGEAARPLRTVVEIAIG
jgi:hypothetical protein